MRILIVLHLFACSYGLITNLTVTNDPRTVFHVQSFGYQVGGKFKMTVSDFKIAMPVAMREHRRDDDLYDLAFILQRSETDIDPAAVKDGSRNSHGELICYHNVKMSEEDDLFMMSEMKAWKETIFQKSITMPGYYHLYFSNCEQHTTVGFTMSLVEFNIDPDGQQIFLSAGAANLPAWYFVIFCCFAIELVVWLIVLVRNRADAKSLHYLMALVVFFKMFELFFESFKYQSLKYSGVNGWAIPFYIFSVLKGMLMFTVIVLIGTGWSYLKPFLTEKDKRMVVAVLVIQVCVNVAAIVLDEEAPGVYGWLTWRDILHLTDLVCCCLILMPIAASIKHLRDAATADGKAAITLKRLKNFRSFYLLVVSYIYFTRIIVFLLDASLSFEHVWFGKVCAEVATLLFYVSTGVMFRPQGRNPYLALQLEDDDVEMAGNLNHSVPYATDMIMGEEDEESVDLEIESPKLEKPRTLVTSPLHDEAVAVKESMPFPVGSAKVAID